MRVEFSKHLARRRLPRRPRGAKPGPIPGAKGIPTIGYTDNKECSVGRRIGKEGMKDNEESMEGCLGLVGKGYNGGGFWTG